MTQPAIDLTNMRAEPGGDVVPPTAPETNFVGPTWSATVRYDSQTATVTSRILDKDSRIVRARRAAQLCGPGVAWMSLPPDEQWRIKALVHTGLQLEMPTWLREKAVTDDELLAELEQFCLEHEARFLQRNLSAGQGTAGIQRVELDAGFPAQNPAEQGLADAP